MAESAHQQPVAAPSAAVSSAPRNRRRRSLSPTTAPSSGQVHASLGPPSDNAPLPAIRGFVEQYPEHERSRWLRRLHDQRLLPCPGARPRCEPRDLVVAEGALDRATSYLEDCLDCRHRDEVATLRDRLRAVVQDLETRAVRRGFEQALRDDPLAAEQVLADAHGTYPAWRRHAQRVLEQELIRRGRTGGALDLDCAVDPGMAALVSPAAPRQGEPVRVLLASAVANVEADLVLETTKGRRISWSAEVSSTKAGAPRSWLGTARDLPPGEYRAILRGQHGVLACQRFQVHSDVVRNQASASSARLDTADTAAPDVTVGAWTSRRGWSRASEDLYSAWVGRLFEAPESKHWHGLFALTRDEEHNVLFNHLGFGEDAPGGLVSYALEPDCADGPYFLRAYFAWKVGLPFAWHDCRYGTDWGPPKCRNLKTNESWQPSAAARAAARRASNPNPVIERMAMLLHDLKDDITARSLRTSLLDDDTDLYPVALNRAGLRPGTVYADPYGHTLALVRYVPQRRDQPGRLLAVDAQPDGTLAIKRFWRGNFLFADEPSPGGHGFKAFRPLVLAGDGVRPLSNAQLVVARGYGSYSTEQRGLRPAQFYASVARIINPEPLDPTAEYRALHEALLEQLYSRVQSLAVAEEHRRESAGKLIEMPEGRGIFHTMGAWEAYSTPCRDLRLLVGIDQLRAFPAERSVNASGQPDPALEQRLHQLSRSWTGELTFAYERSDGTSHTLSLADVIARRRLLEMAYNPNDCPEVRWGAQPGSEEMHTCRERAPAEQQQRMAAMRHWFEKRYACG